MWVVDTCIIIDITSGDFKTLYPNLTIFNPISIA